MRKNILCVDENRAILFLVETLLNTRYSVTLAKNSFIAMQELFSATQFDLLIISINNTTDVSYELLQHISSSSILKNIPIIVLSNNDDVEFRSICSGSGIVSFMKKPFDPLVLLNKIDGLLNTEIHFSPNRKKRRIFNLNFYL